MYANILLLNSNLTQIIMFYDESTPKLTLIKVNFR